LALVGGKARDEAAEMNFDPVTLQLIGSSLLYASEEMGLALRNSSYSPNIKERMDHSAAVFDRDGRLLAQAEHIPVHLGSLPWGLKNLIEWCSREGIGLDQGTMVAANDPYVTGTHLNDVTVAAPVHRGGELVAYVVNKAHHSDVGGVAPGSISMLASRLQDEGYVLEPTLLWKDGTFLASTLEDFSSASRTPSERRGDLKAQAAANIAGARRVLGVIGKYGLEAFEEACAYSAGHSESLTRARLSRFRRGTYLASDVLEGADGEELTIRAKVLVSDQGISVDYDGTSRQVDYPLNAVFGVTISGAYFVIRCLVGDDVPANHGAFAPIAVRAPAGTLVNPTYPHPVAGGNVETSQRNADVLFKALSYALPGSVPAAAGGSMNNVMVGGGSGRSRWAFYETLGVGLGGSRTHDGIDGIQANMTNTMNTPIEEMERSFPVRVVCYEFRADSSGAGRKRGGCGLVRSYMMLSGKTTFTVMADRNKHSPWGLSGGLPGAMTKVILWRGGRPSELPAKTTLSLGPGDVVEIRTAGGGGFGDPKGRKRAEVQRDLESGLVSRTSLAESAGRGRGQLK
jgi:N-methylhydantoinase B